MNKEIRQVGALCFQIIPKENPKVLLITSRRSQRWIIPKGWPIKGLKSYKVAEQEAFEEAGAKVLKCLKKGRGNQLAVGLKKAKAEAVLILHADMLPDSRVVERVVKALAADPQLKGGALGASFELDSFKYKVITFLNLLRVALTGISFGDQGQFFRRKDVVENGCLKEIPLMEDVELGMRLQALGKTRLLDGGLTVSVRRWKTKNVWKNAFHIFYLLSRYLFLRRTRSELKVDGFYKEYYSDKEAETV